MNLKSSTKTDVNMTELVVEIDAESFEKAVEAAYQRQKKNISMPGFRKGKVPRKMCERTYGENVFYEDAINALLNMELPALIVDNELNVVDTPKVEVTAVSKEDGVTMKVICVTKPEISLDGYKGIEAPKVVKEVTDEDVDQQIENMRQRNARVVSVDDRAAEIGDEVNLNFEGFFGDEAFEGGKGENYQLKLGSGQFIPGFEDQVAGHKIGENFDVTVKFPEDYQMEEYAGKEAVFQCDVKKIETKEVPELDDEFAKDVSEFDTLAEYKEDVKKKLTEKKEKEARTAKENAAVDKAIENAQMDIPELMTKTECRQMMDDFSRRMQQQGLSMEQYFQFTGQSMDKMMEDMKPQALKRIQTRLVLEKVAEAENIQPSEEEITEEIQKMADAYKMEADKIREAIGESGLEQMKKDMAVQKAVTVIADAAVEVEKAADAE